MTRAGGPLIGLLATALASACTVGMTTYVIPAPAPVTFNLPNRPGSTKFFVLGDFGNASRQQFELGAVMAGLREQFAAEFVITVGDNLYGGERPQDFTRKFEDPYKHLLDAGVRFQAALGNHDSRDQAYYALFNMGGRTYYSFRAATQDVTFLALESDYPTPRQLVWVQEELDRNVAWKIPYFHHPLYSSGKHGSHDDLREVLEPMFVDGGVTVVFTGHEHFYERIRPQQGITHFVVGSGGQLRRGDIDRRTGLTAVGFDTDRAFLAVEIAGDALHFNAISREGQIVDSGTIRRRGARAAATGP